MADIREFDELDRRIVELMCRSSQGSYRQIAKQLGIHPTTLIQRVKNLEAKGVINGYRAKVDYMRLGFDYMGIIQVYVEKNMLDVQEAIRSIPQVLAVFDVTGECDSIVWIACKDREEFSNIVKSILKIEGVQKTNTSVILNVMKDPADFIPQVLDDGEQ
jgi:DNA-binding Lrp family transcriptional regulator